MSGVTPFRWAAALASCNDGERRRAGIASADLPTVEATELLLNAIRNRTDDKLKGFPVKNAPFVLCIEIGHAPPFNASVRRLVEDRLWPNPILRRMSGVFLFTRRQGYAKGDQPPMAHLLVNPNAANPLPPAFVALRDAQ